MKQPIFFSVLALLAAFAVAPVMADHPASATYRDVQDLQYDLENLDESLRDLDASDAGQAGYLRRADQVREDVTRLEQQIRRHQQDPDRGLGATQDEVTRLRRSIAALQSDIEGSPAPNRREEGTLPEGTSFDVRLDQAVSSDTARREDRVEATVSAPVQVEGRVVLPAGTRVRGVVESVQEAERPNKGGRLDLVFDRITLRDGTELPLRSRVLALDEHKEGRGTAEKAGLGALLGGVLGGIVGGKKGAVVGAMVGGTGAVAATAGQEVTLPAGTVLTLRLEGPVVVARR